MLELYFQAIKVQDEIIAFCLCERHEELLRFMYISSKCFLFEVHYSGGSFETVNDQEKKEAERETCCLFVGRKFILRELH